MKETKTYKTAKTTAIYKTKPEKNQNKIHVVC